MVNGHAQKMVPLAKFRIIQLAIIFSDLLWCQAEMVFVVTCAIQFFCCHLPTSQTLNKCQQYIIVLEYPMFPNWVFNGDSFCG